MVLAIYDDIASISYCHITCCIISDNNYIYIYIHDYDIALSVMRLTFLRLYDIHYDYNSTLNTTHLILNI